MLSVSDARAEALFASLRQPSEAMTAVEVEAAVRDAVRRLRLRGCAACMAAEFGEHPVEAAMRMRWARETVAKTWPKRGSR